MLMLEKILITISLTAVALTKGIDLAILIALIYICYDVMTIREEIRRK